MAKIARLLSTSTILILSLVVGNVAAEDAYETQDSLADFYGDEEFVSIATGSAKAIHRAPAVATIITAEDIASMGATNLNEVLERVPGLHSSISNLSRFDPVFSVRGIHSSSNAQILVLMNGREFKNSINGGLPYMFYLPVNNIQRIEVIRGPGSAIYGADAFSGVINIITESYLENEVKFGLKIGSFESKEFWLKGHQDINDVKLNYSIESFNTDGDSSRTAQSDLQSVFDSLFMTNVSLAPGSFATKNDVLNLSVSMEYENFKLEAWFWDLDKVGLGPGGAQVLDYGGYQDGQLFNTRLSYQIEIDPENSLNVEVSRQKYTQDSYFVLFPAGAVLPIGMDGNISFTDIVGFSSFSDGFIGRPMSKNTDSRVGIALNSVLSDSHNTRLAIGWTKQALDTSEYKNFGPGVIDGTQLIVSGQLTNVSNSENVYIDDSSRTVKYLSFQDEWSLANDWELTYGLRYDRYSDFGSTLNPRLALVWQSRHNLTSKLLYGRAFRPPSFTELFLSNNPVSLGSSNLDPEVINTVELAFDYRFNENSTYTFSFFAYKAEDIIEVVNDINATSRSYQNARDQKGKGFEITYDWKVSKDFQVSTNAAYQDSVAVSIIENDANDEYISVVDAPGVSAYLELKYQLSDSFEIASQSNWIRDRARAKNDLRNKIANTSNSDISFKYRSQQQKYELKFSVKNVFDSKQFEPSDGTIPNDFLLEKRSYWIDVSVNI